MEIDSHIGCAMSGLTADARTMIDHARVECQVIYHMTFKIDQIRATDSITMNQWESKL